MRMIEQGGVRVNGEKVSDKATAARAPGATYVLQVGKRKFARVDAAAGGLRGRGSRWLPTACRNTRIIVGSADEQTACTRADIMLAARRATSRP